MTLKCLDWIGLLMGDWSLDWRLEGTEWWQRLLLGDVVILLGHVER